MTKKLSSWWFWSGGVCGWCEHASKRNLWSPASNRAPATMAWPLELVWYEGLLHDQLSWHSDHVCHGSTWWVRQNFCLVLADHVNESEINEWIKQQVSFLHCFSMFDIHCHVQVEAGTLWPLAFYVTSTQWPLMNLMTKPCSPSSQEFWTGTSPYGNDTSY